MTPEFALGIGRDALFLVLILSAPMLLLGLAVGVIISILQSVTQIQEMTLTFVPKIIAIFVAILVFGKWMILLLLNFTSDLWINIPNYVK